MIKEITMTKNYFVDYEIYSNNFMTHWGNIFTSADTENIVQLPQEIKNAIIEKFRKAQININANNIRFKQFNVI